jgi:hypothetical protein
LQDRIDEILGNTQSAQSLVKDYSPVKKNNQSVYDKKRRLIGMLDKSNAKGEQQTKIKNKIAHYMSEQQKEIHHYYPSKKPSSIPHEDPDQQKEEQFEK